MIDASTTLSKAGNFTITLAFGPQGRNFDSDLKGEVEAELEDLGITLSSVEFSGDLVRVTVEQTDLTYPISTLTRH